MRYFCTVTMTGWKISSLSTYNAALIILTTIAILMLLLAIITYLFFPMCTRTIDFDAYLVLGAAPTKEGTLSKMMRSRVDAVVSQYQSCHKPIIFSGGTPYSTVSEASIMASYAMSQGIPKHHIILEEQARNTYENFACTMPILQTHQFRSICLITNHFHMRRACFFARKLNIPCNRVSASLQPYFHLPYRLFLYVFESFVRIKCLYYEIKT